MDLALEWLKNHQEPDGYWDCPKYEGMNIFHHDSNNGQAGGDAVKSEPHVKLGYDVAVTGLALLAFLGAGHTTDSANPEYASAVRRAIYWLAEQQDRRTGRWPGTHYCHGIAALALAEAYGMGCAGAERDVAQRGINYLQQAQNPRGGWNYHTDQQMTWADGFVQAFPSGGRSRNDTSITGWQVMALKSAKIAGLTVDANVLRRAEEHFRTVGGGAETANQGAGEVFYGMIYPEGNGPATRLSSPDVRDNEAGGPPIENDSAVAAITALSLQYLGWSRDNRFLIQLADKFQRQGPSVGNFYYLYYATLAMFNMGGQYWERWNEALKPALLNAQVKDGDNRGSWNPNDLWGGAGGRVYSTALGAMSLEVYYRYLPVYGD